MNDHDAGSERHRTSIDRSLIESFNCSPVPYPQQKLIHQLFEEQVARTPATVAAVYQELTLTYAELSARSNRLAKLLRDKGVGPDDLVAIFSDRSLEMLVGLLGVWKAGGAYVPIDPNYPPPWVAHVLNDAGPKVIAIQKSLSSKLPQTTAELIVLDDDLSGAIAPEIADPDLEALRPDHLAYVIYTSGSTGQPKGVMIEHRHVVNLWQGLERLYERSPTCRRVALNAPINFDASVQQLVQLLSGRSIFMVPQSVRIDPQALLRFLSQHQIEAIDCTPSQLKSWLSAGLLSSHDTTLRVVLVGGESIDPQLWLTLAQARSVRFFNVYGPTECTVDATVACISGDLTQPHIGRPMENRQVYILDERGEAAPIAVAGEICVGGVGVARGYLNRKELTAARFVTDPFSEDQSSRMYKTGDLGRWRADGTIEYLGRNDQQVKLRGFRIELGEIEAQLRCHPQIKEAVVLAREDQPGEKRLVAYFVAHAESETPSVEALRTHARSALPDHMVPGAFVPLKRMPLTPNGKLDLKALPAPDIQAYVSRPYEAPQGEVENALARIWESLLHVEQVGRLDSFFELGGHSLRIVEMVEQLRRAQLSVDGWRVFEVPRLADLASYVSKHQVDELEAPAAAIAPGCKAITPDMLSLVQLDTCHIQQITASIPGGVSNIQDIYPLTPLQEGTLFHHLLSRDKGDPYVLLTLLTVSSRERLDRLVSALQGAIERHDMLRTAVLWEELPRPVQVVHRRATLPLEEVLLSEDCDAASQVNEWLALEHQRLDLKQAPLLRLKTARDPVGGQWYVLLQLHHIVGDNISLEALIAEVVSEIEGRVQSLERPAPYRDHVAQVLSYASTHDAETFFRRKLADVDAVTAPFGMLDVHGGGQELKENHSDFDSALAVRLRAQARCLGVTAATLFHSAWALVVAGTSGRDDVVFGTVLLGRLQACTDVQRTLGMFINTLPVRLRMEGISAYELVEQTQRELTELIQNEHASLATAQRCSGISGSTPLFTALLNYRHSIRDLHAQWSAASGVRLLAIHNRTNYPIVVSIDDFGEGFSVTAQTDARIDPARVINYLQTAARSLIEALERTPDRPAAQLSILPQSEWRELVELFNATGTAYPEDQPIHRLFEEQVLRSPNAIAAVFEERFLTYDELNRKANQLARYLLARGLAVGDYVPVILSRSTEILVAQIALLKSGAVYVPVDPQLPPERRNFMIRDCRARLVLANADSCTDNGVADVQWIDQRKAHSEIAQQAASNIGLRIDTLPAAYVMYTSGSTGVPKGVVVSHRAVNRLVFNNRYLQIESDDCIVHHSNPSFDASTFEVWGALLTGAKVLIVPHEVVLDARAFAQTLKRDGATIMYMSVGLFNQYSIVLADVFRGLRHLLVGGDSLEPMTVRRVLQHSRPHRLLNAYGPTECTTFTTTYLIEAVAPSAASIPIGQPIANSRTYILDREHRPVPIGVTGELYIGGAGVACGYLNQPELTAERFIPDPFLTDPQARMYRTGDLCRWRDDGVIEYLGRNDFQVKIRGFRIELGEIEAQLMRNDRVSAATVVVQQTASADKFLIGYVVPWDPASPPDVDDLRASLRAALPEYMVPNSLVMLERMPLTSSGKVDRRALQAVELATHTTRQYEPPEDEIEELLCGIWQSLLKIERVGRQDNFFELGGHSLLMVQLMERLRRRGVSIEVRYIFDHPTVAGLAAALRTATVEQLTVPPNRIPQGCRAITPDMLPLLELDLAQIERIAESVPGGAANIQDIYPLSPLQEGILFHHMLDDCKGDTYVLPIVLKLSSRERRDDLLKALQAVVDRHDVLRTAICWEHIPRPAQIVYRSASLPVEQLLLNVRHNVMDQIAEWMKPERQRIDIRQAPLLRVRAAADPHTGHWYVMLQLHHMTIDHVALEIVISEVVAHMEERAQQLPPSVPYRDHVAQSLAYASRHNADEFFRSKLGDVDESTAPFGLLDVHSDGAQIEDAYEAMDGVLAQKVRAQARRLGVSAATLFHAAWGIVVARTSGRDDIVFGTVLLGRMQGSAGAQRTLGMFINTLPLRLRLAGMTASQFVEQTQRELIELLGHEQASLARAQRCSRIAGSTPLFSALLNYRHSVPNPEAEWINAKGVEVVAVQERTNYPITLSIDDTGDGFTIQAQVDQRIAAHRISGYLTIAMQSLLSALEHAPQTPVLALSILPQSERSRLESFNDTCTEQPQHQLVHQLVEEQARRIPNSVAVMHNDESLSYEELDRKSSQLAAYLRTCGVGPNELVAICVERRIEMVIGLVGILKAGGAYLPLDPSYPRERLAYMLHDAQPRIILTSTDLARTLPDGVAARVVALETKLRELALGPSADQQSYSQPTPEDLVYVIYTSGSTGKPKGTAMPHGAMANLIDWHRRNFATDHQPRVLQFAALSFDVAFQEIFSTLSTGGTLILLDEWTRRDAGMLLALLRDRNVERLFVPPMMLQAVAEYFRTRQIDLPLLRDVITAGEQLRITPEIVAFFSKVAPCRLHNHYGPTETHVVTAWTAPADPTGWPQLPSIGCPIANTQIHVLDEALQLAPLEVVGEIYIAGANVARGYIGQPELTERRFVRNPFSFDVNARMYKTGDLGKWRADGTIEYVGRNDDQVKIRGYRIELGEVEGQLAQHPHVREAAVVARATTAGDKRLVAYVTSREGSKVAADDLLHHLKRLLPEHMVPSTYVILETMPLTPSGKLDRRALPAPIWQMDTTIRYEAPEGDVEDALAKVWRSVLGVERIGRQDNFFEIGGHSLLALKALLRINEMLGGTLRVVDFYSNPTVQQLASVIRGGATADDWVDLPREARLDERIEAIPPLESATANGILLTGAAGFVGRFLLAQLLRDTDSAIYCLMRGRSEKHARARLKETLLKWDLWDAECEQRILAVPGDLRQPRLGLSEQAYQLLCGGIDTIFHCATSMNHLETYQMAKAANVDAVKELLIIATQYQPKVIHYISTLGVFGSSATEAVRVIDESSSIDEEQHRSSHGYVASKWVADKIFMHAQARGIACNIFRLGLVWADSELGRFDELQSVYRVLKSCLLSGIGIEGYRYPMAPTPVDHVARAIVHLARHHREGNRVFHISSPALPLEDVFERCNEIMGNTLELRPYYEWVCAMKQLHHAGRSLPAVPLIEYAFTLDRDSFHEHQRTVRSAANVNFDCTRTQRELDTAGVVAPILNHKLLHLCLEDMLARDPELQHLTDHGGNLAPPMVSAPVASSQRA